jgi:excisionase family DNA binding protein
MRCDEVRDRLVAYLDDELTEGEMKEIESHLAECRDCGGEIEMIRMTLQAAHALQEVIPEDGWQERVLRRLNAAETGDGKLSLRLERLIEVVSELKAELSMKVKPDFGEIMTLQELAEYLKVGLDTVWMMVDEIPHFQVGHEIRFRKASVDEWIRAQEGQRVEGMPRMWNSGDDWDEKAKII